MDGEVDKAAGATVVGAARLFRYLLPMVVSSSSLLSGSFFRSGTRVSSSDSLSVRKSSRSASPRSIRWRRSQK